MHDRLHDRFRLVRRPGEQAPAERAETFAVPRGVSTRSIHWKAATTESTNEVPTAPIPISAPRSGILFPKKRIRRNETAGSAGMIQA